MAVQAVVVDLDGTLWDSRPWYVLVASRGDTPPFREASEQLASGRAAATVLRESGYSPASFRSLCEAGDPRLVCFPGVLDALGHLRDSGVRVGAATNLPSWMAEPMAEATGVGALLETIVVNTAGRRHKPHPDPLLEAMRRLAATPSASWYVGDENKDAIAARAAGMSFAWAAWGQTLDMPEGSDLMLARPAELKLLAAQPATALKPEGAS